MAEELDQRLTDKLRALEERSEELSRTLSEPQITADRERYTSTSRAYAELQPIIGKFREYEKAQSDLQGARELLASADDNEMKAMASEEVHVLESRLVELDHDLRVSLLPRAAFSHSASVGRRLSAQAQ